MNQILAFDFDGLLCDALSECILVTWNGYYGKSLDDFSDAGLAAIPASFSERFSVCRSFAKHLAHFYVSLLDPLPPIRDQQAFESLYQSLPTDEIHQFTQRVVAYRALVREQKHDLWLGYHRLYPGIAQLLRTAVSPIYIVTAKDANSVFAILEHAGIVIALDHIYGKQQEKNSALKAIQDREEAVASSVCFFDDNLPNVIAAHQAGYSASWATWGYNAPDHFALAQAQAIPSLSLEQFLQLEEVAHTRQ